MASVLLSASSMTNRAAFFALTVLITAIPSAPTDAIAQSAPLQSSQTAPSPPTAFASVSLPNWVRIGVEHRGRLEGFTGLGFAPDREDLYWLNRFRITGRFAIRPWLSAAVQAQDARVEGRNGAVAGAPFRDQFDLRLAHVDVGNLDRSRIAVRAGRQDLLFGDQRLVGPLAWVNTGRSFDGIRAVFRRRTIRLDGFAASVVAPQTGKFNTSGGGHLFYGLDAPIAALPLGGVVEPYEFVRTSNNLRTEAGAPGDLRSSTTGVRLVGKFSPKTDYNIEMALQRGSLGTDDISAWAGHWAAGRAMSAGGMSYRTFGEYNYASGDEAPGDGARGTFDQLYPTGHDKYGLADQVGWKNIHHLRAGVELKPQPKLTINTSYHSFWLASARDALYSAGSAVLARIPAGAPDRHVGQELDAQFTFTPSARVQLTGGYAHLFAGAFLKAATPGKSYSAPYVMVTTMLLGLEK
jgi:hypothetical protein